MADTYVQLPDKGYVHIPEGTSPDKMVALRNRLASQYADLKTGAGMMGQAQKQATASLPQPTEQHDILNPRDPIQEMQDKVYGTKQEGQLSAAPLPFPVSAAAPPLEMLKGVGRSAVGGWAGSELGGRYFGAPGRVIGGLIGGGIGYKSPEIAEGVANRFVGEENVPMWMKSPQSVGRMVGDARDEMYNDLGARRDIPIEPTEVTPQGPTRVNPTPGGIMPAGKLEPVVPQGPTRVNSEDIYEQGSPENPGFQAKLPGRMPRVGATARTSQLGEPQSSTPGVSVVPEPREALPSDRPGAQWTVPRETLPGAAQRGVPGAADVQRQIGDPIIYTPRSGVGFPGPRRFPEEEIPQ